MDFVTGVRKEQLYPEGMCGRLGPYWYGSDSTKDWSRKITGLTEKGYRVPVICEASAWGIEDLENYMGPCPHLLTGWKGAEDWSRVVIT